MKKSKNVVPFIAITTLPVVSAWIALNLGNIDKEFFLGTLQIGVAALLSLAHLIIFVSWVAIGMKPHQADNRFVIHLNPFVKWIISILNVLSLAMLLVGWTLFYLRFMI